MKLKNTLIALTSVLLLAGCNNSGGASTSESEALFTFSIEEGNFMAETYVIQNTIFSFEGITETTKISISKYNDLNSYLNDEEPTTKELTFEHKNVAFPTAHGHTAIVAKDGDDAYTFFYQKNESGNNELYVMFKESYKTFTARLIEEDTLDLEEIKNAPNGRYYSNEMIKLYDSVKVDQKGSPKLEGEFQVQVNLDGKGKLAGYYSDAKMIRPTTYTLTSSVELNAFSGIGIFNDSEPLAIKDYDETTKSFTVTLQKGARNYFATEEFTVTYGGSW